MHVLLTDDDPATCGAFSNGLRTAGHSVVVTNTGTDALHALHLMSFGAAIVDLDLQDMNGLTVVATLRRAQPLALALVLTNDASLESAVAALRLGVADYLSKPVHVDQLLEHLRVDDVTESGGTTVPRGSQEWAALMTNGIRLREDVRTVEEWCVAMSISRSMLENRCLRVGVSAKAALDLLRLLRATVHGAHLRCAPELLIDADPRTVKRLLRRAGGSTAEVPIASILGRQQLITCPVALIALKRAMRSAHLM